MGHAVRVHVALNDDYGRPDGRAGALEVEFIDDPIRLEACDLRGPVCRATFDAESREPASGWRPGPRRGHLRIGRFRYAFVGYRAWWGSIVWDLFVLERKEAKRLLQNAARSGWWSIADAPIHYWTWWERATAAQREDRSA